MALALIPLRRRKPSRSEPRCASVLRSTVNKIHNSKDIQMTSRSPITKQQAMAKTIKLLGQGVKVSDAMRRVNRTLKTYEAWRATDKAFAEAATAARLKAQEAMHWSRIVEQESPES